MVYDLQDLVRSFGLPLLEIAKARVERGDVEIMPAGPGAKRVFGVVRALDRPAARVTAAASFSAHASLELRGDCTCTRRGPCEHVAAVLLRALGPEALEHETWRASVRRAEAPPPSQPPATHARQRTAPTNPSVVRFRDPAADAEARAVAGWLGQVASTLDAGPKAERDRHEKHRLLYLVNLRPRSLRLTVHPVLAYVKKDGRHGSKKNCGFFGGPERPSYLSAEDRELLPAIMGNSSGYWSSGMFHNEVEIDVEAGARLLARLLATGRCHWGDVNAPPLQLGPALPGRIEWSLDADGRQRPHLRIDDAPDALALCVEPSWYVDPGAGFAGPLMLGEVGVRTAAALLQSPGLTPEAASRVRDELASVATRSRLELPVPQAVEVREHRSAPVPHLLLHLWRPKPVVVRGWVPPQLPPTPAARLTFDYDGILVHAGQPGHTAERIVNSELVRVRRDLTREDEAILQLETLNFIPLDEVVPDGVAGGPTPGEFVPLCEGEAEMAFLVGFGMHAVPLLREAGWVVETADDYPFRLVDGEPQWYAEVDEGTNPWFDLELGVEVDGERHSLLPILMSLLRGRSSAAGAGDVVPRGNGPLAVRTADGRVLVLPAERVRAILTTLTELYGDVPLDGRGALPLSVWNSPRLTELDEALGEGTLRWLGGDRLRDLGRRLRGFRGLQEVATPPGFQGELRGYQREGLSWLQFLRENDLAGVLADDMGLGKTVQVLAHLLAEKRSGRMDRPSLVVAPTSVITNWRREAESFAPDLRVLMLHGQARKAHFERMAEQDLILTTYPLLARDEAALRDQPYHALILDEAQFVKNAKTKAAGAARRLDARHRLCLTGTPMENHLGELWSLFHFLLPGLLGDARQFRRLFRTPIEKHDDRQRREQLVARVRPFLLRRTKDQVATELPPKTEMTRSVELARAQRDLYESIRLAMNEKVRREIAKKGLARSTIVILDALLKLRQVCCDPRLLAIKEARKVTESAKLEVLMEVLPELLAEGRRVLLFSQFTSMIELIEHELRKRELSWVRITGDTRDRDTPVQRFQAGEVPLFLISLKAGGTGLNLTAADTVIHYDPWWNPAVEDQATDRAHRIGQDKPVFVYRLIVTGSVEEKMLALQARKRELAAGVYGSRGARGGAPLSAEDLELLFRPLE